VSSRPIVNPHLRISDAERAEVTEALKRHCSDGRLDSAEFEARLDRTLRAKTRGDLAGLFDDLPDLTPGSPTGMHGGAAPSGRFSPGEYSSTASGPFGSFGNFAARAPGRRGSAFWTLAMVALVIVAGLAIVSSVAHLFSPHFPLLILFVVAFFIWRRGHHHHHHRMEQSGRVEHVDRQYPW
jgi:Domain of unknown function (DUF1707)